MRTRQVDSIINLLKGARFIGCGTTGFCFLLPTGEVIKIYYESERKRLLFSRYENKLVNFFDYLNSFNSETFYGPTELLMKDGKVVGYIMNLAYGKTIRHMSGRLTIDDIEDMITILISDVKLASRRNLRICDMHQRNIMYSYTFKIIDLDDSYRCDRYSYDDLVKYNMKDLLLVITNSLFGVRDNYTLYFNYSKLDSLYKKAVYKDYEEYFNFLEYLRSYGKTLSDLRSEDIHYALRREDYYSKL